MEEVLVIEAKKIIKYFSERRGVDEASLRIDRGDILGIIGGSGAGKSTLMRCLSSLEKDFQGEVLWEGEPFCWENGDKLRQQRQKMGMIFQHFHVLQTRTVEENIAFPLEIQGKKERSRVRELVRIVGLQGKENCYPAQLSGGEKQRVAIARALAQDPEVLFCDEATSSLDPKTTGEILDLLQKVHRQLGVTIVLITHEMDVVKRICNKVIVMEKGRIVEQGNVLEVFASPKHPITKEFMQNSSHRIEPSMVEGALLLTLRFTGASTERPILSRMIQELGIEVNILSGWIDRIEGTSIGVLTVAIQGEQRGKVLAFLQQAGVRYDCDTP